MPNRTARQPAAADRAGPLDIATMRSTADRILAFDATPIGPEDLETLWIAMRGRLELLIPAVQGLVAGFPKGDIPRECALSGAREATMAAPAGCRRQQPCAHVRVTPLNSRHGSPTPDRSSNRGGLHRTARQRHPRRAGQ